MPAAQGEGLPPAMETPNRIRFLIWRLRLTPWPVSTEAVERELASYGDDAVEPLLGLIKYDEQHRTVDRYASGIWVFALVVGILALAVGEAPLLPAALVLSALVSVPALLKAYSMRRRRALRALAAIGDARSVGPLLQAITQGGRLNASVRRHAAGAVPKLLPLLTADHRYLLTKPQRECLNNAVREEDPDVAAAAIDALEWVGDESCLPYLADLAAAASPLAAPAAACREAVSARLEREHQQRTLVRAATEAGSEALLRAAEGGGEAEAETLVRPSG